MEVGHPPIVAEDIKKAEPFKLCLTRVGSERIDETIDPELSINRAIQNYRRLGYDENWINQRVKSIEVRKALTDEWDKSGVKGQDYVAFTDLMTTTWSGMNTREYKRYKGFKFLKVFPFHFLCSEKIN